MTCYCTWDKNVKKTCCGCPIRIQVGIIGVTTAALVALMPLKKFKGSIGEVKEEVKLLKLGWAHSD